MGPLRSWEDRSRGASTAPLHPKGGWHHSPLAPSWQGFALQATASGRVISTDSAVYPQKGRLEEVRAQGASRGQASETAMRVERQVPCFQLSRHPGSGVRVDRSAAAVSSGSTWPCTCGTPEPCRDAGS